MEKRKHIAAYLSLNGRWQSLELFPRHVRHGRQQPAVGRATDAGAGCIRRRVDAVVLVLVLVRVRECLVVQMAAR